MSHKLDEFAIAEKEQSLFELPADVDHERELFDTVCGSAVSIGRRSRSRSATSQATSRTPPPSRRPHKDRYPSQVSVGLSISIPAESRSSCTSTPTASSTRSTRAPACSPPSAARAAGGALKDARSWSRRRRSRRRHVPWLTPGTSAGIRRALNLYFKFNDFGCDPLGEDPATGRLRERTLAALAAGQYERMVPRLSRTLDTVSRTAVRDGWREVLEARVFGEEPTGLTHLQHAAVTTLDGREDVAALAARLGGNGAVGEIVRLAELGVLDLVPSESSANAPSTGA